MNDNTRINCSTYNCKPTFAPPAPFKNILSILEEWVILNERGFVYEAFFMYCYLISSSHDTSKGCRIAYPMSHRRHSPLTASPTLSPALQSWLTCLQGGKTTGGLHLSLKKKCIVKKLIKSMYDLLLDTHTYTRTQRTGGIRHIEMGGVWRWLFSFWPLVECRAVLSVELPAVVKMSYTGTGQCDSHWTRACGALEIKWLVPTEMCCEWKIHTGFLRLSMKRRIWNISLFFILTQCWNDNISDMLS